MKSIDRSIKPEPSAEIKISLPEIEKFKLNNGLEVYFIQKDKIPVLQANLLVNGGSSFDPAGKKGLANLFSMVIDEGAGKYDSLQLSDEFDSIGTHFSVSSSEDNLYFSLQTLKENFEKSLELFSTVVLQPHLDEKDFQREQRKMITRIMQQQDEPDEIADIVYQFRMFDKLNPYAYPVSGYEDTVKNLSIEDIRKFYSNYLFPNNSTIIVVGDISKDELQNKLNLFFNDWKPGNVSNNIAFPYSAQDKKIFLVDKKNTVQSEIRIGHLSSKRNEENYYSKLILNTILGGQFTSRINLNLRERKGYTYGAHSRFNYFKESAYFYVSTSVGIENTANAVQEIFNELNGIQKGVTPEELEFAKSSIIRKFPSNFETNKQIASNLIGMVIHSLPEDYFNNYIEQLNSVGIDDVNSAAEKYLLPEKSVTVIVGDKTKLLEQLKNFDGEILETDINGELKK